MMLFLTFRCYAKGGAVVLRTKFRNFRLGGRLIVATQQVVVDMIMVDWNFILFVNNLYLLLWGGKGRILEFFFLVGGGAVAGAQHLKTSTKTIDFTGPKGPKPE